MRGIPEDVKRDADKYAHDVAAWIDAGNTTGFLSAHAQAGLADTIARAIMAERERCAKVAFDAALYSGCPADFIAQEIADTVRTRA